MKLFGKKENVELTERTFSVEGMMCQHCEQRVKASLMQIDGVKEVSASSALKKVCVRATADVTDAMITEAISAAGYKCSL